MEKLTLKSLFESGKADLTEQLKQLSLPRDAQKVQTIVTEHLNKLFDSEGEYRQHLTQSEDYILQAAMSLLNAQQAMAGEFAAKSYAPSPTPKAEPKNDKEKAAGLRKEQYPIAIGGSAIGGAAGALLLGTWGAVFGAIAGTALSLYYVSSRQQQQTIKPKQQTKELPVSPRPATPLNVDLFISIIDKICDSVDTLVATFRNQIGRVVDKYESMEKPTLENEYKDVLENIQALLGAFEMNKEDENRAARIEKRIQLLAEGLDNYDLTFTNYNEDNKELFNLQYSENVSKDTMAYPAVMKNGKVIIKGKVFTNNK